jgi:hypothetical protein
VLPSSRLHCHVPTLLLPHCRTVNTNRVVLQMWLVLGTPALLPQRVTAAVLTLKPCLLLSLNPSVPVQTAKVEGGPADLMADQEVESSDTNPAMDPSEQSGIAEREGSETAGTQAMSSESGESSWQTLQARTVLSQHCDNVSFTLRLLLRATGAG